MVFLGRGMQKKLNWCGRGLSERAETISECLLRFVWRCLGEVC